MILREKFFDSIRRKKEGYIPFEFAMCPSLLEEFHKKYDTYDYAEFYEFPTRSVTPEAKGDVSRFHEFFKTPNELIIMKDWGVGFKSGSVAHFKQRVSPMANFEDISDFEKYPYPDANVNYDWDSFNKKVADIKNKDLVAVGQLEMTIFEMAWFLRGMENFLVDLCTDTEISEYHLDRITSVRCECAKKIALAGCDILRLGDDVSTQLDMMISPEIWSKFIKPRLARVIKAAKDVNPEIMIFYHGDGNLSKIIPQLIEVGVEILNPVQPECVDPIVIKNLYADRLSFWGTVGTQTTLPFGTPDEVRRVCIEMINEVGKGGGLLLAPTHVLEPEVPWENIEAFVATVKEYNNRELFI